MADEFRLKKRDAGPIYSQTDQVTLWAHDDGGLRVTDEDGSVAEVGSGNGGSQTENFKTYGPYHVDYTDVVNNLDAFTLFTPDAEDVGTLIIAQWWPQVDTWVAFDTAANALPRILIGQDLTSGTDNYWGTLNGYNQSYPTDSVASAAIQNVAYGGFFPQVMAVHIVNDHPVQVKRDDSSGSAFPLTQGAADIFFLMGKLAGLYS